MKLIQQIKLYRQLLITKKLVNYLYLAYLILEIRSKIMAMAPQQLLEVLPLGISKETYGILFLEGMTLFKEHLRTIPLMVVQAVIH